MFFKTIFRLFEKEFSHQKTQNVVLKFFASLKAYRYIFLLK